MENTTGEGQKTSAESSEQNKADANKKAPSVEELMAEIDSLKASKERVLKESKDHATKYREIRDAADAKEKEELTKKEDFKKLLEKEIEKRQTVEKKLVGYKSKVVTKTLDLELARLAPDAQSVDSLKKLLPVDVLEIEESDDDFQISGLKDAVDRMRTDQPYLFKSSTTAKMLTSKPGVSKSEPMTLDKLDATQLARLLSKQNTQK